MGAAVGNGYPTGAVAAQFQGGFDTCVPANCQAFAQLTYYFAVIGPDVGIVVPVEVNFLESNALDAILNSEEISLENFMIGPLGSFPFSSNIERVTACGPLPPCDTSLQGHIDAGTFAFDVLSGDFGTGGAGGQVFMLAGVQVVNDSAVGTGFIGHGAFAAAFVDPFIFIDPVWLADHPGFSVEVSDGIVNAPPTAPEPATLALLGIGLAGLGFSRLRKDT